MEDLHITNGHYFNEYLILKSDVMAVPFCENMMDGDTVSHIYSDEFIYLRSKELNISVSEYRSKMQVYSC